MLTKQFITSQKLGSCDFCRIANSFLDKGKSAISPLFNGPEVLSSASDKAKLFAENFSNNNNNNFFYSLQRKRFYKVIYILYIDYLHLDNSGISLPVFPY